MRSSEKGKAAFRHVQGDGQRPIAKRTWSRPSTTWRYAPFANRSATSCANSRSPRYWIMVVAEATMSRPVLKAKFAREYFGLRAVYRFEPTRNVDQRQRVDAVLCFDVLEHVFVVRYSRHGSRDVFAGRQAADREYGLLSSPVDPSEWRECPYYRAPTTLVERFVRCNRCRVSGRYGVADLQPGLAERDGL